MGPPLATVEAEFRARAEGRVRYARTEKKTTKTNEVTKGGKVQGASPHMSRKAKGYAGSRGTRVKVSAPDQRCRRSSGTSGVEV